MKYPPCVGFCSDPDPSFAWFLPRVAHIRWDPQPVVRRILRWVDNVAHRKDDRRQTFIKAELIEGGTIGPVAVRSEAFGHALPKV